VVSAVGRSSLSAEPNHACIGGVRALQPKKAQRSRTSSSRTSYPLQGKKSGQRSPTGRAPPETGPGELIQDRYTDTSPEVWKGVLRPQRQLQAAHCGFRQLIKHGAGSIFRPRHWMPSHAQTRRPATDRAGRPQALRVLDRYFQREAERRDMQTAVLGGPGATTRPHWLRGDSTPPASSCNCLLPHSLNAPAQMTLVRATWVEISELPPAAALQPGCQTTFHLIPSHRVSAFASWLCSAPDITGREKIAPLIEKGRQVVARDGLPASSSKDLIRLNSASARCQP